jgi:hypothetical protein
MAAFGRQPNPREMRRMMFAERCTIAWRRRKSAEQQEGGWAKWAEQYPDDVTLLEWLEGLEDEQ